MTKITAKYELLDLKLTYGNYFLKLLALLHFSFK